LYKSKLLPINLLRVLDATGGKPYYLGVPREQKDCLEAIAWTFNMSAKEYRERIES